MNRVIVLSLLILQLVPELALAQEFDAGGVNVRRIESEDKLSVPLDRAEEVWQFLVQRFVDDPQFLAAIDPKLRAVMSDELFRDAYFDTPDLAILELQHGVRHRQRLDLDNAEDRKSGRQLMQIKLNGIGDNPLARAEYKFDIVPLTNPTTADDIHPVIGLVEKDQREDFKQRVVEELGINPYLLKPVLTLDQRRRRIYISREGVATMTLSFDEVTSQLYWAEAHLVEIEPEINEILYTGATAEERQALEDLQSRLVAEIQRQFPFVQQNLTPKYSKVFTLLADQLPLLRLGVRFGYGNVVAVPVLVVLGVLGGSVVLWRRRKQISATASSLPLG